MTNMNVSSGGGTQPVPSSPEEAMRKVRQQHALRKKGTPSQEAEQMDLIKKKVSKICKDTLSERLLRKPTGPNSMIKGELTRAEAAINAAKDVKSLETIIKKVKNTLHTMTVSFGKAKKLKQLLETESTQLDEALQTLGTLQEKTPPVTKINFLALSPDEQIVAKKIRDQFVDTSTKIDDTIDAKIEKSVRDSLGNRSIENEHLQIIIAFVKHALE